MAEYRTFKVLELPSPLIPNSVYVVENGDYADVYYVNSSGSAAKPTPTYRHNHYTSGRWYCYTDNRWVTDSDDNYGGASPDYKESAGTGANPVIEWNQKGLLVPSGQCVKKLLFAGHSNNRDISDLELMVVARRPYPITRWETGFNNDSEDAVEVLHRDRYMYPTKGTTKPFPNGRTNEARLREIPLNYHFTDSAYLSLYLKPIGTLRSTRFFRSNQTWCFS